MTQIDRVITRLTLSAAVIWLAAAGVELFVNDDSSSAAICMGVAALALVVDGGWRVFRRLSSAGRG